MKREKTILIILALLLTKTPTVLAQEDTGMDDLSSLIEADNAATEAPAEEPSEATSSTTSEEAYSPESLEMSDIEMSDAVIPDAPSDDSDEEKVELDDAPLELDQPLELPKTLKAEGPRQSKPKSKPAPEKAGDELDELKKDVGDADIEFKPTPVEMEKEPTPQLTEKKEDKKQDVSKTQKPKDNAPIVFDVGREERELLSMVQNIQGQISDSEWNEVATASKVETYTVVKDDWLFKISKRIFGTGYFYPKIWSLNSYITNPHFIEPGMILSFTTGSSSTAPQVKLGEFSEEELKADPGALAAAKATDVGSFGDEAMPSWLEEKKNLESQGVYFQYASEETMDDLIKAGEQALNSEYESYDPPMADFQTEIPKNYDKTGFDKNSRIFYSFKEGFYLSTFVSTNIVQDFGSITNGPDENIIFTTLDKAYVQFDESVNALPGDKFSIYSSLGKAKHENSDRSGYKYAIIGHIKLIRKIRDKWEVEFTEISGTPQRGDRITVYTPKIDRITTTFNSRLIEAGILSTYNPMQTLLSFGDVIYLDRGRADGVEMGNVFEVYGFKDRNTNKNITDQPTYKLGELTVITLTDNFATAIVTNTTRDFYVGDLAMTKTKETVLREKRAKQLSGLAKKELMGGNALEELDVELNLENIDEDLMKQADSIGLTEDELAELERQEREKSVIKDSEKDLKALERLEGEIEQAEQILNDANMDEDKLLENENLDDIEKKQGTKDDDSVEEIEENLGKRYVDEDLNSKDNPFGLSEFDVEEVDELLNVEKKE